MRTIKLAFAGILIAACFWVFCSKMYPATRDWGSCTCCETSDGCGGKLVATASSLPRPEGCTKSGADCAGSCYRCSAGSATGYCRTTTGDAQVCYYDSANPTMICGKRVRYDCGGTWASNCSCPTSGGTTTDDNCVITKCDEEVCY